MSFSVTIVLEFFLPHNMGVNVELNRSNLSFVPHNFVAFPWALSFILYTLRRVDALNVSTFSFWDGYFVCALIIMCKSLSSPQKH